MLVPFFSAARVRKTEQSSIYFLMKSRAFARKKNSLFIEISEKGKPSERAGRKAMGSKVN